MLIILFHQVAQNWGEMVSVCWLWLIVIENTSMPSQNRKLHIRSDARLKVEQFISSSVCSNVKDDLVKQILCKFAWDKSDETDVIVAHAIDGNAAIEILMRYVKKIRLGQLGLDKFIFHAKGALSRILLNKDIVTGDVTRFPQDNFIDMATEIFQQKLFQQKRIELTKAET